MNKKFLKKKNLLSLSLGMAIIIASASLVFAAPVRKTLKASYNNIKLIVDGKKVSFGPNDQPFIVDGVTYLPIRKVGEAMGKEVGWDQKTNTITIGEPTDTVKDKPTSSKDGELLVDQLSPIRKNYSSIFPSTSLDSFYINNVKYGTGINLNQGGYVDYKLDKKYSSLTFDYGVSGDHTESTKEETLTITSYDNKGSIIDEETLYMDKNSGIRSHTISIKDASKISFSTGYHGDSRLGIGDPVVK